MTVKDFTIKNENAQSGSVVIKATSITIEETDVKLSFNEPNAPKYTCSEPFPITIPVGTEKTLTFQTVATKEYNPWKKTVKVKCTNLDVLKVAILKVHGKDVEADGSVTLEESLGQVTDKNIEFQFTQTDAPTHKYTGLPIALKAGENQTFTISTDATAKYDAFSKTVTVKTISDTNDPSQGNIVTLKFDPKNIVVYSKSADLSGLEIGNGKELEVGTKLVFEVPPSTFSKEGKIFDGFRVNGTKRVQQWEIYVVDVNDAVKEDGKNVLNITFVHKEKTQEKVKINFPQNIKAEVGGTEITTGESFEEGTYIRFEAQASAGKFVDRWFINDRELIGEGGFTRKSYRINVNDAKQGVDPKVIEVRFEEKEIKEITLQFDDASIEKISEVGLNGPTINQNATVKTGQYIEIYAKKEMLAKEKLVDYFTINGDKNDNFDSSGGSTRYVIDEKDAKQEGDKLIIKIGAIFRDRIKATVRFDNAVIKVTQYIWNDSTHQTDEIELASGTQVKEGEFLTLEVKNIDGKKVEKWLCNKDEMPHDHHYGHGRESFEVTKLFVKKEGESYVLDIEVVLQDALKFTIKFDSSITCHRSGTGGPIVANGTKIEEERSLVFIIKKQDGKVYESWLINGKVKEKIRTNPNEKEIKFYYKVNKDDAVDGTLEVKVASH